MEIAILGGGCFWCLEAVFLLVSGVQSVESGYAAGQKENPTYKEVCSGTTGHAEVVKIVYDPKIISYKEILDVFWKIHDPTTLNRQGNDEGTQYRSIIIYQNEDQKQMAEKSMQEEQKSWKTPIVTQIEPFRNYYPAEKYHQNYYNQNQNAGYCYFIIRPKIEKYLKEFKK